MVRMNKVQFGKRISITTARRICCALLRCSRAHHSSPQDADNPDPEHAVLIRDHAEGQHVDRNPGDQALG
eukprot:3940705-Rhodomonas_salina.3